MSFSSISDLWNKWNIRGSVVVSLSLQVFLILFAPLRKKIANRRIIFLLWLAYLMADSVAIYGIGLISHNQGNSCNHAAEVNRELQAFWASFLLLHLGGPDTITAFSLEDSSLWERHLLTLIFQVGATIYLFLQIFHSDKSLVIPTMLVFLAGVIKNAERTLALNLSSLPSIRESVLSGWQVPGLDLVELVKELNVLGEEYSNEEEAKLAESVVVKHAYIFFQSYKAFLADLFYSSKERFMSREYFHKVSAVDALRVITVELHFMYEVLHTKALAIRFKWSYIFRFIAITKFVMAFVMFNRFKKHQLPKLDVKITYILLFGGIAFDVIAVFMLVFSDWTVARIKCYNTRSSKVASILHKFICITDYLRKPRFATYEAKPNTDAMYMVLDTPFIFQRWSESILACNFFSEFWKKSQRKVCKSDQRWGMIAFSNICSFPSYIAEKIIYCFHQTHEKVIGRKLSLLETTPRYMSNNPFISKLWIFIFNEVRRKSRDTLNPTETMKIYEARGDLFLQGRPEGIDCSNLLEHVTESTYDVSVITWHIATEIWYNIEKPRERNDGREFSKILSDYMLYIFLNQPNVVSDVAGFAPITLVEALLQLEDCNRDAKDVEGLCKTLYEDPLFELITGSESVLSAGIKLSREMERLGEMKWDVMSRVWVEMLSYAAGHIKGQAHVLVLSKGGELLAFVWLLMAHFGCLCKPEWGIYGEYAFETESETPNDSGNQEEDDRIMGHSSDDGL